MNIVSKIMVEYMKVDVAMKYCIKDSGRVHVSGCSYAVLYQIFW